MRGANDARRRGVIARTLPFMSCNCLMWFAFNQPPAAAITHRACAFFCLLFYNNGKYKTRCFLRLIRWCADFKVKCRRPVARFMERERRPLVAFSPRGHKIIESHSQLTDRWAPAAASPSPCVRLVQNVIFKSAAASVCSKHRLKRAR